MTAAARARAAGSSITNDDAAENSCCTAPTQDHRLIDAPLVCLQRQLECVRREIRIRRQIYPTRIATSRMSAGKARYELAAMEAVAETLVALIEGRRERRVPGLQRFETAVRPAGAECEIDRYLAGDPKTERRFSAVSSEINAALREVGETVMARHADSLDDLRAEHERLIDEISGIEQRFQELAERIALAFRDIRADLNAERPDLGQWEWPQPSEPKEDPDSLFDSRRSYVEQIDRYKRHQGKPTARRKRNGEVTS